MPKSKLRGLGRRFAPDNKDLDIEPWLPPRTDRVFRYWWDGGGWYSQGDLPQCVEYGWRHWVVDGPVTGVWPYRRAGVFYNRCQRIDEWDGENYDGTSGRAGAKILRRLGIITEYRFGRTLNKLIRAVLELGPVGCGTNWYEAMDEVDGRGYIHVNGGVRGGHWYVVNGVNTEEQEFRIKNSWGRGWGQNGRARISFADMERLISEQGEIVFAKEAA